MESFQKLKIELLYNPDVTNIWDIYPENSVPHYRNTCTFVFIDALFMISRKCSQSRWPSVHEWVMRM